MKGILLSKESVGSSTPLLFLSQYTKPRKSPDPSKRSSVSGCESDVQPCKVVIRMEYWPLSVITICGTEAEAGPCSLPLNIH